MKLYKVLSFHYQSYHLRFPRQIWFIFVYTRHFLHASKNSFTVLPYKINFSCLIATTNKYLMFL